MNNPTTMLYVVPKTHPSHPMGVEWVEGQTEKFWIREGGSRFSKSDPFRAYFTDLGAALRYRADRAEAQAAQLESAARRARELANIVRAEVGQSEAEWREKWIAENSLPYFTSEKRPPGEAAKP